MLTVGADRSTIISTTTRLANQRTACCSKIAPGNTFRFARLSPSMPQDALKGSELRQNLHRGADFTLCHTSHRQAGLMAITTFRRIRNVSQTSQRNGSRPRQKHQAGNRVLSATQGFVKHEQHPSTGREMLECERRIVVFQQEPQRWIGCS